MSDAAYGQGKFGWHPGGRVPSPLSEAARPVLLILLATVWDFSGMNSFSAGSGVVLRNLYQLLLQPLSTLWSIDRLVVEIIPYLLMFFAFEQRL
jgi:hypothetical protein